MKAMEKICRIKQSGKKEGIFYEKCIFLSEYEKRFTKVFKSISKVFEGFLSGGNVLLYRRPCMQESGLIQNL